MRRRLLTFGSAVSLLLCVAVAWVWYSSFPAPGLHSLDEAPFYSTTTPPAALEGFIFECGVLTRVRFVRHAGPWEVTYDPEEIWRADLTPLLFAACALTAVPPARWLYLAHAHGLIPLTGEWLRRRRRAVGQCPRCGYDLRATPDCCPECGAPAKVNA